LAQSCKAHKHRLEEALKYEGSDQRGGVAYKSLKVGHYRGERMKREAQSHDRMMNERDQ
jgi:hypothetical protein